MTSKEELKNLRNEIDSIDSQLIPLFSKRMRISENVAKVKEKGNIAILDSSREEEVIRRAMTLGEDDLKPEIQEFMRIIMAMSRIRQGSKLELSDPVYFPPSKGMKSEGIKVAFQGLPGAWSEQSAAVLFPDSEAVALDYFDDVFHAVKDGKVDYGVLPIENSQTGAIGEVYDLLRRHSCYIVGQVWITASQCLLAKKGTDISDIREVFSHPQGFNQCSRFLKNKNWDLTSCRNTAVAASMVAEKDLSRYAAIGSRRAAEVYNLDVIAPDIVDNTNNKTRFITIADKPIYNSDSDITSITFSTAHKSGALCAVLQSFMLSGINLSRIESRPASSGAYRFFVDLQANIDQCTQALRMAAVQCDYFEVLGCYSETTEFGK